MPLRYSDRLLRTAAIVAAGGLGQRFGGARPKQLYEVGGRALLERSVSLFLSHAAVDEVVVALPAEVLGDPPAYLRVAPKPLRLVAGGARRQDSVFNAFAATSDDADVIVIHDAARPFAGAALIDRTLAAAAESGAAVAAVAARDTVKRVAGREGSYDFVAETLPRERIYLAQTPQAFTRRVLRDALALAEQGQEATDEATLAERAGHPVRVVEGELSNIKVTVPEDLPVAEAIAREGRGESALAPFRIGTGYDLHRLVEGRALILGGVTIPFERGLLGHSDADAVCHAVTDAVLGAAAAGDIGRHFPDTDPRFHNASSLELLRMAMEIVNRARCAVVNVDVVIVAERPKIAPHVDAMRANLAAAMGIDASCVNIKGKTNEGVDATGRGEAIATHAIALVCRT